MTGTRQRVVIVGGGQAAASTVIGLRQWGFEGTITLVGDEAELPYQRPPLSKAYMKGALAKERLYFKPPAWYAEHAIELHLGDAAVAIDRDAATVATAGGTKFGYDALVIATGARARKLAIPGAGLANVFELRTLRDVESIRPQLASGRRLVIVGAGYIGLEAAAVATQLGLDVTVLEYAPRVLERVTSPVMSEFFAAEHRRHGVHIETGARISSLVEDHGTVCGVALQDDRIVAADLVLIGVGIEPNIELAERAGLECADGIVVDADARSNDPQIFAAGDCARRPLVHYARAARLESVHNAIEQGRIAAAAIAGHEHPREDCPWFWSDQYDLKLQIAGLSTGYDESVVRGDPAARHFAVFYLRGGKLLAVDAINSPQEFVFAKKMIIDGSSPDPQRLAAVSVPMKEIIARKS